MYTKKWKQMSWFQKMTLHDNLGLNVPSYFHIWKTNPPYQSNSGEMPRSILKSSPDFGLIRDLLQRYPDLKFADPSYSNLNRGSYQEGNYVFNFINQQKSLMRKGYTKEKAFEIVEKKFQARFSEKIEAAQLASRLAVNNNARSLLSVTQQQAEMEATLKVKRITRDIPLYQEGQAAFEKTLFDLENQNQQQRFSARTEFTTPKTEAQKTEGQEQSIATEEADFSEFENLGDEPINPAEEYEKKYVRVLHKVVPQYKEGLILEEQVFDKDKRTDIISSFITNTKNMFNLYYERASALDKLSGLSDREIMDAVVTTPTRIKKQAKKLLKQLEKHNIKLDATGEVDYSGCSEPNVVKKLRENPLVKAVLMQSDLQFEFAHREHQLDAARLAKEEYAHIKGAREAEERQREEEQLKERSAELSSTSESSPFHQQYNIQYPAAEPVFVKEVKETAREKAEANARLTNENLSAEATYRVFETYEERMMRLEKKWLKSRLVALEGGIEKPSEEEQSAALTRTIEKLRRLKYLVEQKNLENAKNLLFAEHRVFTKEEILADKDVSVEKLYDYLRLPDEKRRLHSIDEIDDNKILEMIRRKEVLEDTVKPYQDNFAYKLSQVDSFETKFATLDAIRQSELGKSTSHKMDVDESYSRGGDEDIDEGGKVSFEENSEEARDEKKRLMEYIKEATVTKAAGDVQKQSRRETKKEKKAKKEAKKEKK